MFHFDIGQPTFSEYNEDGFLEVQVSVYGDGSDSTGCPPGEVHPPFGFMSRPLDTTIDGEGVIDPANSGQTLHWWDGPRLHVIPTQDPRVVPKLPALKKGEGLVYGAPGNFVRCHADGAISLFTSDDGTPNGKSVYMRMTPAAFERIAPWVMERCDAIGYSLVTRSGARLDLGNGGMPAPLAGSTATISADSVGIDGGLVTLGNPNLPQDAVAKSTALLAWTSSIQASVNALKATFLAFSPGAGGALFDPTTLTAMGTAVAASSGLTSGLTTLLPAASVTVA